jgi:hypothetical protein
MPLSGASAVVKGLPGIGPAPRRDHSGAAAAIAVEETRHIHQGQILALTPRRQFLKPVKLSALRSEAAACSPVERSMSVFFRLADHGVPPTRWSTRVLFPLDLKE